LLREKRKRKKTASDDLPDKSQLEFKTKLTKHQLARGQSGCQRDIPAPRPTMQFPSKAGKGGRGGGGRPKRRKIV